MANAKLEWIASNGHRQSYTFPVNFSWGYQELLEDNSDWQRALDGTLRGYTQKLKACWTLKFSCIGTAQKDQLAAIKQAQGEIDFFRDAQGPKTFTAVWRNDFDFREVAPGLWSGTIVLVEV